MKLWLLAIRGRSFIAPGLRKFDAVIRACDVAGLPVVASDDLDAFMGAREVVWNEKLGVHEEVATWR